MGGEMRNLCLPAIVLAGLVPLGGCGGVDIEKVKTSLPLGNVIVKAVKGGLDVPDPESNDPAVIASAAIAVRIEVA